jgi:hypothetical protein
MIGSSEAGSSDVRTLIHESSSHVTTAEPRTTYAATYGILSRDRIPLLAFPSLICRLDFSDRSSELYPTMTIRRTDVPVSLSELRGNDILHLVRLVYMRCWMTGGRRSFFWQVGT